MPRPKRPSGNFEDAISTEASHVTRVGCQFADDLVPKFSGQDKVSSVSKWIQDVEDNAETLGWTPLQQLIHARRSLVGTAALWLRTERTFRTWDELKYAIAKEFPDVIDQKTLHEMMSSRKKREDESFTDYVLIMKEMAKRGKMADYVAIKYIVDGIQDAASNKMLLYGVTTYADLKEKLCIYETVKEKTKIEAMETQRQGPGHSFVRGARMSSSRCYSCGDVNHQSRECPKKHLGLKCFKCNGFGHIAPNCRFEPQRAQHSQQGSRSATTGHQYGASASMAGSRPQMSPQVGEHSGGGTKEVRRSDGMKRTMFGEVECSSVGSPEVATDAKSEMSRNDRRVIDSDEVMVSAAENENKDCMTELIKKKPKKTVIIKEKTTDALIDTGSDVSLMSEEFYRTIGSPAREDETISLSGLGQAKVHSIGKLRVPVKIDDRNYGDVVFHIVNKDAMPYDVIIGQEFLRDVTLIMNEGGIVFLPSGEDWLRRVFCSVSDAPDYSDIIGFEASKPTQQQVISMIKAYQPLKTREAPIQLRIILKDDIPVAQRPRRLAISEQQEVEKQVEGWLRDGIVQVSFSEYASPLVLVRKKDGSVRICIDYRLINKKMVKDEYPLPIIEDHIDKLAEAKVYSTIDLKNAYFHLPVHEDSVKYTAFVTHNGQYEFLRAPFGLAVCPKVFTRFITIIFRELISRNIVMIFIDDLIIPAQNELQAVERLQEVLQVASQYGLEINWKKSRLVARQVEYLGHLIEDGQVKPSPDKTEAVRKFPEPKTVKQLQSFVGLTSYFRKFIENYALIAKPLTDLLRKDCDFRFNDEQKVAFETLKSKLSSNPVLQIYNSNLQTELHTDASSVAYAAVLMQKNEDDGLLHPVYYMSRKTTDAEARYSSYELEALAVIEGIKKFRKYLFGIKFKIVTDCKAFQMTLQKRDMSTSTKVARWIMLLQEYDFSVEHRAGSQMRHVDALSRNPYIAAITSDFQENIKQAQARDGEIKAIMEIVKERPYEDYWLENGLIFKGVEKLLVIPRSMETEIIRRAHENGHFGKKKTTELIKKDFYIKNLDRKVDDCIQSCIPCLLAKRKAGKQEGFLAPIDKGETPLDTLHLDHIGPMTETKKQYNHILTMIDAFTKFTWIFPTKSTTSKEVIDKLKVHQQLFGNPRRIITDRGTAFTSNDFSEYCKEESIEHVTITTGIPRGNGQVERIHRVIKSVLTKLCIEQPSLWYRHVSRLQQALNSTFQRSVNTSPHELLVGAKMRLKQDTEILSLVEQETRDIFMSNREELRKKAKEQILKVQEENRQSYNKRRKKSRKYQVGDLVAIKRTQFGVGMKLKPKFLGPYKISKVKGSDRYDVEKVDPSKEGPKKTSSAADYMKKWPEYTDSLSERDSGEED